eukprot:jgi/Mesen1/1937/ME000146S01027
MKRQAEVDAEGNEPPEPKKRKVIKRKKKPGGEAIELPEGKSPITKKKGAGRGKLVGGPGGGPKGYRGNQGKQAKGRVDSPQKEDEEGPGEEAQDPEEEFPGDGAGGSRGDGEVDAGAPRDDEDEEEESNFDLNQAKIPAMSAEKMQAVLGKFTPEQMSRYESYRRSGFQRSTMKKLLDAIIGERVKVSPPITIVISGIAKLFVGELVETGRVVMTERNETGPIRPSHMREAYRRLKQDGKVPVRAHPPLFR